MKRQVVVPALVLALLAACNRGLPPSLQRDVRDENERVQSAESEFEKSQAALNSTLAQSPNLFAGSAEPAEWKTDLGAAKADLQTAMDDRSQLIRLVERNRPDPNINRLLGEEQRLRQEAQAKTQVVDLALTKWRDYQRDPAAFVSKVNRERAAAKSFNFEPVEKVVHKAEQDWPAKKAVLETRFNALTNAAKASDSTLKTPAATLIADDEILSHESAKAQELETQCGQLYDSWDKILTDLDRNQEGRDTLYRERIKTVRTHYIDVPLKKTETHSDEHWTQVSEAGFQAVENDIGMAIAHKDAGRFDSEAQTTPQPPGFSYVAPPSVGSNQYGYWSHNGGESVWTFLPQYLILRELLWNHDYHPVMVNEYNSYWTAQRQGTTYYGRESPTAPPKYGTHGTFTQSHYADSRYVQSGGFKGSAYASRNSSGSGFANGLRQQPQTGLGADPNAGRRFGRQPGAAPSGQHFGHAPSARPPGRAFGRRR